MLHPAPRPFCYPKPMPKHSSHILELAKVGAEHRYQELKTELASLVKLFPHLAGRRAVPIPMLDVVMGGAEPVPKRGRKPMSAAAKKAFGERMKKYWAERRKATK